ncbi:hypothetical protein Ciccas_006282 [Cichlidogyrus casuarinus]|uniref:RING-type domain-containing protein n=1 Tax=Cichlidogyrus casuarinus TaxID=1844966 RepID=A0ABD2Q695_9PLAT
MQEVTQSEAASEPLFDFGIASFLENIISRMPETPAKAPSPNENARVGGFKESLFLYLPEREREEFLCCICYFVMDKVYQCRNEHRFCYSCIYTWSSGASESHDRCPMCRVDGCYASNEQINERILEKGVACEEKGCNWLGSLRNYLQHEHRYYAPQELKVSTLTQNSSRTLSADRGALASQLGSRRRHSLRPRSPTTVNFRFSLQNTVAKVEPGSEGPKEEEEKSEREELEYKRLVPQGGWRFAFNHLQETREQLTTMLNLMTLQLEERRRIAATHMSEPSSVMIRTYPFLDSTLSHDFEEHRVVRSNSSTDMQIFHRPERLNSDNFQTGDDISTSRESDDMNDD